METKKPMAVKVTLSTGKVVLLRELKISHTEQAAQQVASKANGDSTLLQLLMQKQLVKNLLISIDDKALTPQEREGIDDLFSIGEYNQLLQAIREMTGDAMGNGFRLEVVSSGDK
jgi:hypothetical protein